MQSRHRHQQGMVSRQPQGEGHGKAAQAGLEEPGWSGAIKAEAGETLGPRHHPGTGCGAQALRSSSISNTVPPQLQLSWVSRNLDMQLWRVGKLRHSPMLHPVNRERDRQHNKEKGQGQGHGVPCQPWEMTPRVSLKCGSLGMGTSAGPRP